MPKNSSILTLIFIILSCFVSKADIILNNKINEVYSQKIDYQIYSDVDGNKSFEQIKQLASKGKFEKKEKFDNFQSDNSFHTFWIKLELLNKDDRDWLFEIVTIYAPIAEVHINDEILKTGHFINLRDKHSYQLNRPVFELNQLKAGKNEIFIKVKNHDVSSFLFKIQTVENFAVNIVKEHLLLGVFYGILFIVCLYNSILFVYSREKLYFKYVLYIVSCILLCATIDGLAFTYIWPNHSFLNYWFNYYIAPWSFIGTFLWYSISFIEVNKYAKNDFKAILFVAFIYLLIKFLDEFFITFLPEIISIAHVSIYITLYVVALRLYFKTVYSARLFVLAYSLILFSLLINELRMFTIIPTNLFTINALYLGILIEVIVMTFAIGEKLRSLKLDKDKALKRMLQELKEKNELKEKINLQLEQKVQERTVLLEEANKKLEEYMLQLKTVNVQLDKDKWDLNKQLSSEVRARVVLQDLSFEEFTKAFPNEISCQKYIEELKWKSGYKCKKCGNDKFASVQKLRSRKCSKCDYVESSTADTLFHGVKFPLPKAFYLAYLTTSGSKTYTLDDLVEITELSKNTCWKFKQKVQERLAQFQAKYPNKKKFIWEELVYTEN